MTAVTVTPVDVVHVSAPGVPDTVSVNVVPPPVQVTVPGSTLESYLQ